MLINSTGDGTIGRASYIYDYNQKLLYDSHILLLRPNKQLVNGKYLAFFINSQLGQNQIEKIKSANSTKQTELGINNFKKIEIPLPPLEIQSHIAMRIQKLKDYIKILKQQAEQNREDALKNFEAEIFSKE